MTKDINKTRVQFLYNPDNNDLFAFFPDEIAGNSRRLCYSIIGQHSDCTLQYAHASEEATPEQYKDLKQEIEGLGYNLDIINQ